MEDWILDKRDLDELFYCIKDSNFPNSTKLFLLHKIVYATTFLKEFACQLELPFFDKETATKEDYDKLLENFCNIHNDVKDVIWQRSEHYDVAIIEEPDKTYVKEKNTND